VGVLPIDLARDEVVLIRQFRLPVHLANGNGDLVEIVAGHVEPDEPLGQAAHRECLEEIGVAPSALTELFTYLPTPGASDEQITLFLGIVDAAQVPDRAGAAAEREETQPFPMPRLPRSQAAPCTTVCSCWRCIGWRSIAEGWGR